MASAPRFIGVIRVVVDMYLAAVGDAVGLGDTGAFDGRGVGLGVIGAADGRGVGLDVESQLELSFKLSHHFCNI